MIDRKNSVGPEPLRHCRDRSIRKPKIEIPILVDERRAPAKIDSRERLDYKRTLLYVVEELQQRAIPEAEPQQVIDLTQRRSGDYQPLTDLLDSGAQFGVKRILAIVQPVNSARVDNDHCRRSRAACFSSSFRRAVVSVWPLSNIPKPAGRGGELAAELA